MISQNTLKSEEEPGKFIFVKEAELKTMATQEIEIPNIPSTKPKVQPVKMSETSVETSVETSDSSSPVIEINCQDENGVDHQNTGSEENQNGDDTQTVDHMKNGVTNPVFMQEDGSIEETIPPVTYVDFLPTKSQEEFQSEPIYSDFSSLVEQANEWLTQNREYSLWKCETITFFVNSSFETEQDAAIYMESAFGITRFVSGLRLWLLPQVNTSMPVVQIGFTTAIPGTPESEGRVRAKPHSTIQDLVESLNKQFLKRPIPGVILNIEQVEFHENETSGSLSIDPDRTFWTENGSENIIKVSALRIFFIKGKEEYAKIGFHDELPDVLSTSFVTSIRFGPFRNSVKRMGYWLKHQKGIRVVHLQSINSVISVGREANARIDASQCFHIERSSIETRYAKVLRAFFIHQKSDEKPYESINLSTRLFTPVQTEWTRNFESVSKTFQRTIKWLSHTRVPPFSVESVQYQVTFGGETVGPLEDKVDKNVRRSNGRHQLSTFRLYFTSEFTEPPVEVAPPEVDTYAGWGCVVQ